jgi:hypothetical protein
MNEISIKKIGKDVPSKGAIPFNCSRHQNLEIDKAGYHTRLGNPFVVTRTLSAALAVRKFSDWLRARILADDRSVIADILRIVKAAESHPVELFCYCGEQNPCHCEVIRAAAEHYEPAAMNERLRVRAGAFLPTIKIESVEKPKAKKARAKKAKAKA